MSSFDRLQPHHHDPERPPRVRAPLFEQACGDARRGSARQDRQQHQRPTGQIGLSDGEAPGEIAPLGALRSVGEFTRAPEHGGSLDERILRERREHLRVTGHEDPVDSRVPLGVDGSDGPLTGTAVVPLCRQFTEDDNGRKGRRDQDDREHARRPARAHIHHGRTSGPRAIHLKETLAIRPGHRADGLARGPPPDRPAAASVTLQAGRSQDVTVTSSPRVSRGETVPTRAFVPSRMETRRRRRRSRAGGAGSLSRSSSSRGGICAVHPSPRDVVRRAAGVEHRSGELFGRRAVLESPLRGPVL